MSNWIACYFFDQTESPTLERCRNSSDMLRKAYRIYGHSLVGQGARHFLNMCLVYSLRLMRRRTHSPLWFQIDTDKAEGDDLHSNKSNPDSPNPVEW